MPENSTWQERKEALPYDTLRDPAHVPMTAEERQILQDLGGNGKERVFVFFVNCLFDFFEFGTRSGSRSCLFFLGRGMDGMDTVGSRLKPA